MNQSGDFGEQALSRLAEAGISSQLDEIKSVDVDIKTTPLKLMQGELESVAMTGTGMVMQKDLRVETMTLQTEAIAINPIKAMLGTLEVTQSTEAAAHVVLTEADINRALGSDYVRQRLQALTVVVDGQSSAIEPLQIEFQPGDNQIAVDVQVRLQDSNEVRSIAFTAVPRISANHQQILLEDVRSKEMAGYSPELTNALIEQTRDVLDLQNFELDGMDFFVQQLGVDTKKITLRGAALIENFTSKMSAE